ncbi:MAG: hypothetical protein N4A74_15230 [Carboxylicivirga sp.]|jgi:hypothetical protein|nr:hypothetical protein [Carboxylicivirga sp.]
MKTNLKQYLQNMLKKADRQDSALSRHKRKLKWIAILSTLFTLYILSFLQPHFNLKHHNLGLSKEKSNKDSLANDSTELPVSPFELPTDSFEQLLNQKIHENAN